MTLSKKLDQMQHESLLEECITLANTEQHMSIALIKWTGLPEKPQTYSWLNMLCKRHGKDYVKEAILLVLETGTTVDDFSNDPRHFRSWFTATVKGKANEKTENIFDLNMFDGVRP